MTEIEKFLEITPENLAKKRYEALQNHALSVVKALEKAIISCNDNELPTFDSPAGDYTGEDNVCINFGFGSTMMDVSDLFFKLKQLKKISEGEYKE